MTDEERAAAWDRVAAEMRAFETGRDDAANAIVALTIICATGLIWLAILAI